MSRMFPRETRDWQPGDKAYCVRGGYKLVKGRVYRVTSATRIAGLAHTGLTVEGIDIPPPYKFIGSNRFIRLRPRESALRQIDAATEWTTSHYWERPEHDRA